MAPKFTWTNYGASSKLFYGIHLREISQEVFKMLILRMGPKLILLMLEPHDLRADGLKSIIAKILVGASAVYIAKVIGQYHQTCIQ